MLYIAIDNSIGGGTGLPGSGGGGGGFTNTYSLDFDGVDTSVQIPALDIDTTSDLTLSCWVKSNGFTTWDYLVTNGSTGGTNSLLNLRFSGGGALFSLRFGSSVYTGLNGFADGNWHHIAMTINYTNGDVKFYKDGVVSSTVLTWGSVGTIARIASIGAINSSGSGSMSGSVDEFAVFQGLQSITDLYNSGTPADLTDLSPIGWYRNGDNGSYKSPQWLIPNNENKDKLSNYSFDFDGIDDYINLGSGLDIFGSDFTISLWAKWGAQTSNSNGLINFAANTNKAVITLGFGTQYGKISFGTGSSSTVGILYDCGSGYNDNNWHHIMCTFQGTTRTIYVDGVDISSTGSVSSIGVGSNNDIGNRARSRYFVGNIDEVSIFNSVVPIGDLWDGSGEPTTLPSGAVAHWRMGEESTFTSNWLVNNSVLDNYSTRSFDFDGVDDYVNTGITTTGTNNLTISCWIKTTETFVYTQSRCAFGGYNNGSGANYTLGRLGSAFSSANDMKVRAFNTLGTTKLNDGNWHNIIYTYDYTTKEVKAYVDGNTTPEVTATMAAWSSNYRIAIGWNGATSSYHFEGNIDECAVWYSILKASDITAIWNSGTPTTLPSEAVAHYRMGEDASFNGTNWTVPDQVGTNNGTSANMTVDDLVGEAPNYSGGGISSGMTIEDRVGEAPNSDNNALSFNMNLEDRVEDTP